MAAVASRYGRAFVDLLLSGRAGVMPQDALGQIEAFEGLLAESRELREVLQTPAVSVDKKRVVVRRLAEELKFSDIVRKFLLVVTDHNRFAELSAIRESVSGLIDQELGIVRAQIATARNLDQAERSRLIGELSRLTGKRVEGEFTVDPELLGGVTARIGSTIYDGSVRGRLAALKHQLVG